MAIHSRSAGIAIDVNCDKDISLATAKKLIFRSPTGRILERQADFATDGSDGILRYVTTVEDLIESGTWKVQPFLILSGFEGYGNIAQFTVTANLSQEDN